jgi:hypothetical protein
MVIYLLKGGRDMEGNLIYRKVLNPDRGNGETPTVVELIQENSCFVIWYEDYVNGRLLLAWIRFDRSRAIETAVEMAQRGIAELIDIGICPR